MEKSHDHAPHHHPSNEPLHSGFETARWHPNIVVALMKDAARDMTPAKYRQWLLGYARWITEIVETGILVPVGLAKSNRSLQLLQDGLCSTVLNERENV